jgi:GNAT superfamily N-acetyltransferase
VAVLGTDPTHQGEGVGSALVRHVLDDRANAGEPTFLETETEANVPVYERRSSTWAVGLHRCGLRVEAVATDGFVPAPCGACPWEH